MALSKRPSQSGKVWSLASAQHGVVSRAQLSELGYSPEAIQHRLDRGRLHLVWPGVYAVGRPELTQKGRWMAAVLACGEGAALSHESAAALWDIRNAPQATIDLTVPRASGCRSRRGIRVHRRDIPPAEIAQREGIPLTSPLLTLVDLAASISRKHLEAAINEADKLDVTDPDSLRAALSATRVRPGTRQLRECLDEQTFTLTDSELERRFLKLATKAGLPKPRTQARIRGFRVDFHWPDLNLVVETDGLRYHRTPAQQTKDRLRDQKLTAAGVTVLRFTHRQVAKEPDYVRRILVAVVKAPSPASRGAPAPRG